ncbi:MAG TPA: FAD-dependent oxidoreductase [Hyphomicrobiales bacterium]|nr:FAD-dependent oxidoreductase [Hyphomicrobiales bacterium]
MTRIAIIGAGMTGLSLARLLVHGGCEVTVFEKSRGLGGRMGSRRVEAWQFDHGAQFFTARHPGFLQFLAPYLDAGLVQQWQPKVMVLSPGGKPYRRGWFEPHYVAQPTMTSLAKSLAASIPVVLQQDVKALERSGGEWQLRFAGDRLSEPFDWVVACTPASLAIQLLPAPFCGIAALRTVSYAPSFSLMLGFDQSLELPWGAARILDSPLGWAVHGQAQRGRQQAETFLLQSNHDWAAKHAALDMHDTMDALEAALRQLPTLENLPRPSYRYLHRWRYAALRKGTDQPFYLDPALRLAACGDWGLRGDVESAWLSADALHTALKRQLAGETDQPARSRLGT